MPRIQTGAVIWYSGTPTRLPFKSSGLRMPLFDEMKMHEWRKKRDGNAGVAMNGGVSVGKEGLYGESDISEGSKSRLRLMGEKGFPTRREREGRWGAAGRTGAAARGR